MKLFPSCEFSTVSAPELDASSKPLSVLSFHYLLVLLLGLLQFLCEMNFLCLGAQSQAENPFHEAESSICLNERPLKNNVGIVSQGIQTRKRN